MISPYEKQLWLSQFSHNQEDLRVAEKLLSKCIILDKGSLFFGIQSLIVSQLPRNQATAFYIEREIRRFNGRPQNMYKSIEVAHPLSKRKKITRAEGMAFDVIKSPRLDSQEVGSEALLTHFIYQKFTKNGRSKKLFLNPSTKIIRDNKIRSFVIVTDLIGSGNRVIEMINSLWQVPSFRSWHSYKYTKIYVLCFASTQQGQAIIEKHSSKPKVLKVIECPTIYNSFNINDKCDVIELCNRYGTFSRAPLGYDNSGVLLSFEHSIPNNTPAILGRDHKKHNRSWSKLFPSPYQDRLPYRKLIRELSIIEQEIYTSLGFTNMIQVLDKKLYHYKLRCSFLGLFLIMNGVRFDSDLLSFTKAPLFYIYTFLEESFLQGYLTYKGRAVTPLGKNVYNKLVFAEKLAKKHLESSKKFYYPQQLRAPRG